MISPSYFSGFSSLILELVRVLAPIAAGGGAAAGGTCVCFAAVHAACHNLTASSIKSFATYGAVNYTWVTWLYRS